jgi:glucose-1-phosphate cytidylyltransferase
MKVAILAGGQGTRLAEETAVRPKPMVEIGGRPILWHIMKHYAHFGFTEFVIALGYKGECIKRYFLDCLALESDLTVDLGMRTVRHHQVERSDWVVDLIDTGESSGTGGRIRRLKPHLGDGTFMVTWGDGVSDVDLRALLAFHNSHGRLATMTVVRPPARFGRVVLDGPRIVEFKEKPTSGEGWINGAFFVLEPGVFDYIEGDETMLEQEPLERLAADGELMAYRHSSFWQCMDTIRDKALLQALWEGPRPPWKVWE